LSRWRVDDGQRRSRHVATLLFVLNLASSAIGSESWLLNMKNYRTNIAAYRQPRRFTLNSLFFVLLLPCLLFLLVFPIQFFMNYSKAKPERRQEKRLLEIYWKREREVNEVMLVGSLDRQQHNE